MGHTQFVIILDGSESQPDLLCLQAVCHLCYITDGLTFIAATPKVPPTHSSWVLTIGTMSTPPSWTTSPHCPVPSSRPGFGGSAATNTQREAGRDVNLQPSPTIRQGGAWSGQVLSGLVLVYYSEGSYQVILLSWGLTFDCKARMNARK